MPKTIFRTEALERLASPEQLDRLMPLTSPRGWISLAGAGVLLLGAILWATLGSIATTVEGYGVLVRPAGIRVVECQAAGAVVKVAVRIGESVRQGQTLIEQVSAQPDSAARVVPVVSPVDGRVMDIAVVEGETVKAGMPLLTIEMPDCPLQAIAYVPVSEGYQVAAGMEVQVLPANQGKGGSRFLRGRVHEACKSPASTAAMTRVLRSEVSVERVAQLGPMLEIVSEVTADRSLEIIYSGTPCRVVITLDKRRPIQLIFPMPRDS